MVESKVNKNDVGSMQVNHLISSYSFPQINIVNFPVYRF